MSARRTTPSTPTMSILESATAQIEGLAELDAAIEIAGLLPDLETSGDFPTEFDSAVERALTDVRNGSPIPPDVAERALLAKVAPDRIQLTAVIRQRVAAQLIGERQSLFIRGTNTALAYLADQLEDILEDVRATTGDLTELAAQYDRLRHAQQTIVTQHIRDRQLQVAPHLLTSIGYWRDSINRSTFWLNRRAVEAAHSNPTTPAANAYVEWLRPGDRATINPGSFIAPSRDQTFNSFGLPTQQIARTTGQPQFVDTATPWWPDTNRTEHLTAIAHDDAAWLPTIEQLVATRAAAEAMTNRVVGGLWSQHTDARAQYYDIIGREDPEHFADDTRVVDDKPRTTKAASLHDPASPQHALDDHADRPCLRPDATPHLAAGSPIHPRRLHR